jgi:hypothetical protein
MPGIRVLRVAGAVAVVSGLGRTVAVVCLVGRTVAFASGWGARMSQW